jgi:hypothetical protein
LQIIQGQLEKPDRFIIAASILFVGSALFCYLLNLTAGTPSDILSQRLIPLAWWLTLSALLAIAALLLWRGQLPKVTLLAILLGAAVASAGISIHATLWERDTPHDVLFMYREGNRLLEGENPYARVLTGDMLTNEKYATLLPLFYELSAGTQLLGLRDFKPWLSFWKAVFLLANLGVALVLFSLPYRRGLRPLALFAAFFWLFNRWTLHLVIEADIDFIPIFLLVASLALLPKHQVISFLLYGLSLSVKQIAIFILPLYLIWAWQSQEQRRWVHALKAAFWIAVIPTLISLPFLFWNPDGFIKSILFSATRLAEATNNVLSLDALLGWSGILAKVPMVALLVLAYWLFWGRRIQVFTAAMLVMATFIAFNSVLFSTYMTWLMPFIPLAVYEVARLRQAGS